MPLEVIGAGFGRTGTNSLKLALEQLGLGPCHHMFEVRDNPRQLRDWEDAAAGKPVDWRRVFRDYRSQVDWPGARYWRELAQVFPEAKVILTVRDRDAWFDSVQATILEFLAGRGSHSNDHVNALAEMANETVARQVFHGRMTDRGHAIAVFDKHVAEVQSVIPEKRLLTFNVAEGWEPLCAFLGKPVPAGPFPFTNSSQEFREKNWKPA